MTGSLRPKSWPKPKKSFGIVTPFARKEMTFSGIPNLEKIKQLPGYKNSNLFLPANGTIGPVSLGYQNYFHIEIATKRLSDLLQQMRSLASFSYDKGEERDK